MEDLNLFSRRPSFCCGYFQETSGIHEARQRRRPRGRASDRVRSCCAAQSIESSGGQLCPIRSERHLLHYYHRTLISTTRECPQTGSQRILGGIGHQSPREHR